MRVGRTLIVLSTGVFIRAFPETLAGPQTDTALLTDTQALITDHVGLADREGHRRRDARPVVVRDRDPDEPSGYA